MKEILVIDDHFEMLQSLRSMLELSNGDYRVLGVPSAEEGFFELGRTPFDLLITDVRLPGMSGFELVRKVREYRPDLPIIMITAYSTAQGKQEAQQLGVNRYFQKPLDAEALLAAVYAALYQGPALSSVEPALPLPEREQPETGGVPQNEASQRLQSLLSDTGAVEAILVDAAGEIMFRVGQESSPEMARAVQITARALRESLALADVLQSEEPFTIHYQAGSTVDLYSANVGRHYFIMLLFNAGARRARIGTVWIFAQRAVNDLKDILPVPRAGSDDLSETRETPELDMAQEGSVAEERSSDVPPFQWPEEGVDSAAEALGDEHAGPSPVGEEREFRSDEETLLDLLEAAAEAEEVDLDAFWDDAAGGLAGSDAGMRGFSYEEAVRRGLLPPDLDEGEE